jgi:hypothetical protein
LVVSCFNNIIDSYDIWVEKILGKDDSSSDIAPIKIDLYENALDDDPVITTNPPCVIMINSTCERTRMSPRGEVNRRFKTFMSGLTNAE